MSKFKSLAELRENKGLTQAGVAKDLGMTPQGYGLIERGERGLKAIAAKKLAEIFGVGISDIVFLATDNNQLLSRPTGTDGLSG